MTPQRRLLLDATASVILWIRFMAKRQNEQDNLESVIVLADLAHNWSAWIAGNDFFTADIFAAQIEEAAARSIKHWYWTGTVVPSLRSLAVALRCQGQ